ncbi:hypothetical protein B0A62_20120 [Flavobacterium hydatis]|uniref:Uncharacterized protein n=1 Tax=Flavobacterium hydatis TaxID=991 RepID=A0A086AFU9_FLAHY|nr:hypothetical protein IW20_13855 [Flavobacterium hydatis]OXA89853.1 hypothetical protein B0A62_20120 [Flavobacterium hydatis]
MVVKSPQPDEGSARTCSEQPDPLFLRDTPKLLYFIVAIKVRIKIENPTDFIVCRVFCFILR